MKTTLALIAFAAVCVATVLVTTSCGTAAGFGRDMQNLGRGIENVAR